MEISWKKSLRISDVVSFIGTKNFHLGQSTKTRISGVGPIHLAKKGEITFCSHIGKRGIELISRSNASLIFCHTSLKHELAKGEKTLIFVENPRLVFIRFLKKNMKVSRSFGFHPTSIVETKKIGKNVFVGPHVYISKNVRLGNNVRIDGHVYIYDNVQIGNNVIIQASSVIGADGFGPERNSRKELESFPQLGGVKIQDDVEIGSNVSIMRGALSDTVIGKGSKIGHLVNIGHHVKIGKHCYITSQALIAGGSEIGNYSFVGAGAKINDLVKIGNHAYVGMGAVVLNNVPDHTMVVGVPAKKLRVLDV